MVATSTPGITTLYNALNEEQDKEDVWEHVRLHCGYAARPSRRNTFFAFRSKAEADFALAKWNMGDRELVRVVAAAGSNVFEADGSYLDCEKSHWRESAEAYWSGLRSDAPLIEVIISGRLYFPDWETFSHGFR